MVPAFHERGTLTPSDAVALLATRVPPRVFRRGDRLRQAGAVSQLSMHTDEVSAVVHDGLPYRAWLRFQNGRLQHVCQCSSGEPCRHVVAAALAWQQAAPVRGELVLLPLRTANSLSELLARARQCGLQMHLEVPIDDVASAMGGSSTATALLALSERLGGRTLAAVLEDKQLQRELERLAPGVPHRDHVRAVRAWLESTASKRPAGPSPLSPEQLEAMAREKGVEAWLDLPVRSLEPSVVGSMPVGGTVRHVLTGNLPDWFDAAPLRARLLAWLDGVARRLSSRLEAEDARVAGLPRPPEPVLAELFDAIAAARRRALARPNYQQAPSPEAAFELSEEPLELRCFLERVGARGRVVSEILVSLPLEKWREGLKPRCECPRPLACHHVADALGMVLELLARGREHPVRARLHDALALPSWGRALRAMERQRPRSTCELVSWRVGFSDEATPRIAPYLHRPNKRGGYSSGTRTPPERLMQLSSPDSADHQVAALVAAADAARYLRPVAAQRLCFLALESLSEHPRVFLEDVPDKAVSVRRARLGLSARTHPDGSVTLHGTLLERSLSDDELGQVLAAAGRHLGRAAWPDLSERCLWLIDVSPELARMLEVARRFAAAFPPDAHESLLERISALDPATPVELPDSLRGSQIEPDRAMLVRARVLPDGGLELKTMVRPLPGGPAFDAGDGPKEVATRADGRRVFARRDLEGERAAAKELLARLGAPCEGTVAVARPLDRAMDVVEQLERAAGEGLLVEWQDEPLVRLRAPQTRDIRLAVREGRDWFGLEGHVEIDGETLALASLLDAVRRGQRWVEVKPRRFAAIKRELAEKLAGLAELSHPSRSGLEVSPAAAAELESLAPELGSLDRCESFAALASRLARASREPAAVPAALAAELRPYQVDGFRWLAALGAWAPGACLADDMGLGKTVQTLALLLHRAEEAERFAPSLEVKLYHGEGRSEALGGLGAGDVLVTSWALLAKDVEHLSAQKWATFVLDEAQAVKNASTARSAAARRIDAAFRVALTGTPLENHLGELWSLFRIVFPGLLGSHEQFRERFSLPIERDGDDRRRQALARLVRPFLLRRTKSEVARELPARTEIHLRVRLSQREWERYEQERLAAVAHLSGLVQSAEGDGQARFQVLAALTRLRQLACNVKLVDGSWTGPSSKLDRLVELLVQLVDEGHRVLVFSQFTRHLELARAALAARDLRLLYLDGSTPQAERAERVDRFQAGEADVFLISLKAGGFGLNLTAADYVVHLDPWWNPAVEDQAADRAHRIGQTRPVTIYRLVAEGTVEEAILSLHAEKRALVEGVLGGTGVAQTLSPAELLALIREGAARQRDDGLADDDAPAASQGPEATEAHGSGGRPPAAEGPEATDAHGSGGRPPAERVGVCLSDCVESFRAALQAEHAEGALGPGPVKAYPRSVERFVRFVDTAKIPVTSRHELDHAIHQYLEALDRDEIDAPSSEHIVGRTALRRFARWWSEHGPSRSDDGAENARAQA